MQRQVPEWMKGKERNFIRGSSSSVQIMLSYKLLCKQNSLNMRTILPEMSRLARLNSSVSLHHTMKISNCHTVYNIVSRIQFTVENKIQTKAND
jgi:hypothetical protein